MNYEINIALNGQHFFATALRSLTSMGEAVRVYEILQAKFPKSEGYTMQMSRVETRHYPISNLGDTEG